MILIGGQGNTNVIASLGLQWQELGVGDSGYEVRSDSDQYCHGFFHDFLSMESYFIAFFNCP